MFALVNDYPGTYMDNDTLRLRLEENLISTLSDRTITSKLNSLRIQKQAMCKFNDLLSQRSTHSPTWDSLIISCAAIRRMAKMGGCLR